MLSPDEPRVVEVCRIHDVLILKTSVDFNDIAWNTVTKLMPGLSSPPGTDEQIEAMFRRLLHWQIEYGTLFINPQFFIQAPRPTARFFKEARRAQRAWFKVMNTALVSPRRVKRHMRPLTPMLRQLYGSSH